MKIIINKSTNPYYNLALEEYFLKEMVGDFFILWQNEASVIVGKNQVVAQEVNMDLIKQERITVARRMTGGGAVYHDMGNVNFTFILPLGGQYIKESIERIVQALRAYGITAQLSGRNDLLVDGYKISGMAQIETEDKQLIHGTLLYDVDLDIMESVLKPPMEKMRKHGVSSVKSRVANIKRIKGTRETVEDFFSFLKNYFIKYFELEKKEITEKDKVNIERISTKFAHRKWIYKDENMCNAFEKYENMKISIIVEDNHIKEVRFWGDFIDVRNISIIEQELQGCLYSKENIKNILFKNAMFLEKVDIDSLCDVIMRYPIDGIVIEN